MDQKFNKNKAGVRHLQCILLFVGNAVAFSLRVNLSVAIVAMTDKKNVNPNFEEFDWDEKVKSYILGSFFWGYVVTQIPGGYVSQRFGAKWPLFFGLLICSVSTILTPWCSSFGGWKLMFASRLLQGLCQGTLFPSCHVILSNWCPPQQRGVLASFAYSGSSLGTVIMLATSGIIASSIGWPSIFYFPGIAGLVWSVAWFFLGSSSPAKCKLVSAEEKQYIETSLGKSQEKTKEKLSTPWSKVLKCTPFWALVLVNSTTDWGYWTLLTQIPSYMKGVLRMDIAKNALLSSVPYCSMCIMGWVFIASAKVLRKRGHLSTEMERKLFNTIGTCVPMISLIGLGFVTSNATLAVALLVIACGFNSAVFLGFQLNHMDLASNFAGTLIGVTNCIANFTGVLAPLTVGFVVTNEHDPAQWRTVFFITSVIYFIGNLGFVIFGTTKEQAWNNPKSEKDELATAEELQPIKSEHNSDQDLEKSKIEDS